MTTKNRKSNAVGIYPDINPRDVDSKYYGSEPLWTQQPEPDLRQGALSAAFNWYSKFCDKKMAREQLINYVKHNDLSVSTSALSKVSEREIIATYGWLARANLRGLTLTEQERERLHSEINRLCMAASAPSMDVEPDVEQIPSNRPSVQDIMRDRAREVAGELEGWLDDFIVSGAKSTDANPNPMGALTERNVLPQHISILSEVWRKKLVEFQEVLDGKDKQLTEGYSQYSRNQIKAMVKFCEAVLQGLGSYINVKKAAKAPRKRKAQSPEKIASKMKYLKEFKDATMKLDLVGVHPSKIIGATEVWCYDTAKRKLHYYVADSHVGTLGVKGTTIVGFDTSRSGVKTIRKPSELFKKFMSAGKPATRKLYSELTTTQTAANGRTNENLLILKVW